MITFIHTADVHIGVENYGKMDSETGINSRLLDFKSSFKQVIDYAINNKADFFLFCGDAYKTAFPTPTQQKLFMQELLRLQNEDIPAISIVGNHDHPLSFGKSNSLELLDYIPVKGFHVFSKPQILNLKTKNGPIQIIGLPWPTRNNIAASQKFHLKSVREITKYLSEEVSKIIKSLTEQLDKNIPAIIAGHLTISSGIFSGSEKCAVFGNDPLFLSSELALKGIDYVALGHLHRHQNLNPKGYPPVVYSGSIDRIDFGERKEEKGFCKVTIDNEQKALEKRCKFEFIKLKNKPMIQIEVDLRKNEDQTEQILSELRKKAVDESILKIIYNIPENEINTVNVQDVHDFCKKKAIIFSIQAIKKSPNRTKRINLDVNMDLKTLMEKYFSSKKVPVDQKKRLFEKIDSLFDETDQEELILVDKKNSYENKQNMPTL